jgi:hypothetical protein
MVDVWLINAQLESTLMQEFAEIIQLVVPLTTKLPNAQNV